jgi:thymidylate kinase
VSIPTRLAGLFEEFERDDVRWCVLRLPAGFGKSAGDIDLLVDWREIGRVREVLRRHAFVQLPGWAPGRHWLAYDGSGDRWLWLHIVTELAFGPYALLDSGAADGCLNRRQRRDGLPTLAPDDAFWMLVLHCLLDKGRFEPRHQHDLQALLAAARSDGPPAELVQGAVPPGWSAERIRQCVERSEWQQLEATAPAVRGAWMRRCGLGAHAVLARRLSLQLSRLRHFRRRRGLSVAVLGPDGAGKSTLVAGVQDAFILPVRSVYMGLTGGVLPQVDKLTLPFLVIPGRMCVFWFRYLRAMYHQARGRLVVFDRYTYDAMIPTPRPLSQLRQIYRRMDGHSCPPPDLVLVLDAPGETMFARKREYTPEMLEEWRKHFLVVQQRVPNAELVDASQDAETVLADVLRRIWQRYATRWDSPPCKGAGGQCVTGRHIGAL